MRNKQIIMFTALLAVLIAVNGCHQLNEDVEDIQPFVNTTITGGTSRILDGELAGESLDLYPQIKSITSEEWKEFDEIPGTGLYLVDTDYVPYNLDEQLEDSGVILNLDGTVVDYEGEPVTLFLYNQTIQVTASDSTTKGDPYVFDYYSWSMRWKYDGGYCRHFYAYTDAYAWGPELGGGRPRTKIEYIYTYARISGHASDSDYCYYCDEEHSKAHWKIGCGWPAFGAPCGYNYAYWRDGSITGTHDWSWCQ
jgi:hypothetical protein